MRWTLTDDYQEANHAPVVVADKERNIQAKPADFISISARDSFDPDGNNLRFEWFEYPEAGNNPGRLTINGAETADISVKLAALSINFLTISLLIAFTR